MMKNTTKTARRTRSLVAVAAAAVLLPGLLAACSSGTPKAEETSASKSGSGASLASCMRDKGYDMPDPSSSGRGTTLSAPEGVDQEQWSNDLQSCMGESSGAGDGGFQAAKPMPGSDEKLKEMAQCIRDGGFSDYPDGQDAQAKYQADDQSAFEEVAGKCSDEAFGEGGTVVEQ
jgi:hypothetical protein